MLAVHGFFATDSGVGLWAEDPMLPVTGGGQATRSARPHPFAARLTGDHAQGQADSDGGGDSHGDAGGETDRANRAALLLPSGRQAPLDSPDLLRTTPRPASRTAPTLRAWTVPVMWLRPDSAPALLADIDDRDGTPVRYGASVRHLGAVAGLAIDLVDRGRVLPRVELAPVGGRSGWRPVLQGSDLVVLQRLIAAMPPVGRAQLVDSDHYGDAGQDPRTLVVAALEAFVDAVVRTRLAGGDDGPLDLLPARRGRRRSGTVGEAWLAALTSPTGAIDAGDADLDVLAGRLAPWDEVGTGSVGAARLTLRLIDPGLDDDAGTGWQLQFLLQSTEDPSLLLPAEQIWDDPHTLAHWVSDPQELLLTELGRAARISADLQVALNQRRPATAELDAAGAYRFLSEDAPSLDSAGFGLLLPSWWSRPRRLSLSMSTGTPTAGAVEGTGRFGRHSLVDFNWQLSVGDSVLTEEDMAALAEAKSPLVRLRGQWVAADPEQLRRGLEFLRRKGSGTTTVGQVLLMAARRLGKDELPLPLGEVTGEGWLGALLAGTADEVIAPVDPPPTFLATLRPYQARGLAYLAFMGQLGLGACLADDMGLGKTIQLLALEARQRADEPGCGPSLLICPMSVVGNWQKEAAAFAPTLRIHAHHGPNRLRGKDFDLATAGADLVVTTYGVAYRDTELLTAQRWNRLILDEAQVVKNSASRQAAAVRAIPAEHRIALTGTPMENRLAELWSVMDFVNPGLLGSLSGFRASYAIPVERYGETEPARQLRAITRPYLLRRLKTDPLIIDDLPEKIEIKQYCPLTTEQASLYRAVVDEMLAKIEDSSGIARRGNVLAAMAALKQVCNHPAQFLHDGSALGRRSGKVTRILELLGEIVEAGEKVLCFTQYTEFAELLLPLLQDTFGRQVLYLHGGTSKKRRDEMVRGFQESDDPAAPSIFLLSLRAGGTGLTLTAANHVIHLDRWWNPAVENQATDRAYRIGQRRAVEVHKLICTGTLEEKIDAMLERKKVLADSVIGDGESWLTELSSAQLRELFTLSGESGSTAYSGYSADDRDDDE